MRPQGSKVANFENIDLRELRVTPASLRLRRIIIGSSITYILVFTPVMGYFIWNYMMAAPDLSSRHRHSDSVESAKSCSNRRLPSFHFALNKAGRHGEDGSATSHVNDSHHDLPSSGRQLESVANMLRDRNHQANLTSGGGGPPVNPTVIGLQQGAVIEGEKLSYAQGPESARVSGRISHVDKAQPVIAGPLAAEASGHLLPQREQQEQQREPGKQADAGGQTQLESMGRAHPPAGFKINQLPVQIGHQEMAVDDGQYESPGNDDISGERVSRTDEGVGSAPLQDGGLGVLNVNRDGAPALSQNDEVPRGTEGKGVLLGSQESSRRKKGGKLRSMMQETLVSSQKVRERTYVDDEFGVNDASEGVRPRVSSIRQRKDNVGVIDVGAANSNTKSLSYASDVKASGKDKRGYKGSLSSAIGRRTAEELRRLRSEKLMLKLRKQRNLAKESSGAKRGAVSGDVVVEGDRGNAGQVDVALQQELHQMTGRKGRNSHQIMRDSGAGFRDNREQSGSAASSAEKQSDKQRMIEGIPSDNKEANEVLSFAEFFKTHHFPKHRHSKAHDGIDALRGRRLMIDYMANQKAKSALVEGFAAGGWPEKPETSTPTKYTLDPYHPYLAKHGAGWDFYDPLRPATERNNARELAEQEFYSPDRSAAEVRRRLAGRLLAAPPSRPVSFFGVNESSLQELPVGSSKDKGSSVPRSEVATDGRADIRPEVSATLQPGKKVNVEDNGRSFRANKLSPNFVDQHALAEATIPAVFRYPNDLTISETSSKLEEVSADVSSAFQGKSDTSLDDDHNASSKLKSDPVRGDYEKISHGNPSRDKVPRSKASLPDIGDVSNSSPSASVGKAVQGEGYHKGPDSNAARPNQVNSTVPRSNQNTENEVLRGRNTQKDDKSRHEQKTRGVMHNEENNVDARDNVLPLSGSRNTDADKKSDSAVDSVAFAGVTTDYGHATLYGSGAAGSKSPERDSASIRNGETNFARNDVKESTSAYNAGIPKTNASGARNTNSKAHQGLMNIEPIPIERPDFMAVGDTNVTNMTTPDDAWSALGTHAKEYDDIVPEGDRNIFQSAMNHSHNKTLLNDDTLSANLSASLPTLSQNETQNFEPEVMDLTPPKVGSVNPKKLALTRSPAPLSSPGSPNPGPLSPHSTWGETDDIDDVRNHEENFLRIDARAVTKAEAFTEPPNVDVLIQNKVATSGKLRTTGVVVNEVPKVGVPKISGYPVPSGGGATRHISQTTAYSTKSSRVTQPRHFETPTRTTASAEPRRKPGLVGGSTKAPAKSTTLNDGAHRSKIYASTSAEDRHSKSLKILTPAENASRDGFENERKANFANTGGPRNAFHSEGFEHHNVSTKAPKVPTPPATISTRQSVESGDTNGIIIEVLKKSKRHRRRLSEGNKRDAASHSSTDTEHRLKSTTSIRTASTTDVSKRAANGRALAKESSTSATPSVTVNDTPKKSTRISVPSEKTAPLPKDNSTRSEDFKHSSTHSADERVYIERITPSTRRNSSNGKTNEGKSSVSTTLSKLSVTDSSTTHTTGQYTRASDINPGKRAIHEDKPSATHNRNALTQVGSVTRKFSSVSTPAATTAHTGRIIRSEINATKARGNSEQVSVGGGKTLTPIHFGRATSEAKAPSIHTVFAKASTFKDKGLGLTREIRRISRNSSDERPPQVEWSTTRKLDRRKEYITSNHSTNVPSEREVPERTNKPISIEFVTKASRRSVRPPSRHSDVQITSPTTSARAGNRTRASTFKDGHLTSSVSSPKNRTATAEVATTVTRDTPIPEVGSAEDMLGMLHEQNKMAKSTSGVGERTVPHKETSTTSFESHGPDVSVDRTTNPHPVTVSQRVGTEQTHVDQTTRAEQTSTVEVPHTSFKEALPAELQPKVPSSEDVTTTSTEPTALVFDNGDDEYEDEAKWHFPMMRITRRPSTTPRRPALMDLFGPRHFVITTTTTLRPVLLHNIVARRGSRDRNETTRHHRLEHDIALRRRRKHQSPSPKPYDMTLFHGEPLHAVRIAVKRRG